MKNAHQADTAASKPAITHSTAATRATPSTNAKPRAAAKPKAVTRTRPTPAIDYHAVSKRLDRDGDDYGAYCMVIYSVNRDGTTHLAAVLDEKGRTGLIELSAQTAGGHWYDNYDSHEVVDADTWNNHPYPGMTQTFEMNVSAKLSNVTEISGQLLPDNGSKLRDCAVAPMPGLGLGETNQ
ncbi:hypothetical protein ACIBJF_31205 [Streptomyces sp. NPDC050743]|uniref:hypothetical protein n=1 Tax=Streptomyces sp. NPDC050743 TaxID=3365634 RepID=UPI00378B031B